MTDKKKKAPNSRNRFLATWIFGIWLAWFAGLAISGAIMVSVVMLITGGQAIDDPRLTVIIFLLILLPVGTAIGKIQQNALKNHFGIYIPKWWWMTALSWAVGFDLGVFLVDARFAGDVIMPLWVSISFFIILLGLPGIVQAWLLKNHLPSTWIYGLAMIVGAIICGTVLQREMGYFWAIAPTVSSVITAIVLLWLTSPATVRMNAPTK